MKSNRSDLRSIVVLVKQPRSCFVSRLPSLLQTLVSALPIDFELKGISDPRWRSGVGAALDPGGSSGRGNAPGLPTFARWCFASVHRGTVDGFEDTAAGA